MAATTAGIYWCLVLTGCMSLAVSGSLVQTVPPNSAPVCPGGRLVFTCTANLDGIIWRLLGNSAEIHVTSNTPLMRVGSFYVATAANNGLFVSTATNESVSTQLDGTTIECSGDGGSSYAVLTINVKDVPDQKAVSNVTVTPITNDTLLITWNTPSDQCIDHYTVTIISNNTLNGPRTTNNTDITINDLIIGTNYTFIIIPIDTIGREGPPSSLIQYIWNVPAQVVNISWDQISNDSITIWWNITQDPTLHYPPVGHYVVVGIDPFNNDMYEIYYANTTNATITGLSLTNQYYTVIIITQNIIGYAPYVIIYVGTPPSNSSTPTSPYASSSTSPHHVISTSITTSPDHPSSTSPHLSRSTLVTNIKTIASSIGTLTASTIHTRSTSTTPSTTVLQTTGTSNRLTSNTVASSSTVSSGGTVTSTNTAANATATASSGSVLYTNDRYRVYVQWVGGADLISIDSHTSHYADLAIDTNRRHYAPPTHQPSVLYSSIKPVNNKNDININNYLRERDKSRHAPSLATCGGSEGAWRD
uniref:Fibronectin type-III domain-containing protein n=1 Tax=Amphimedon queenslandica TaxID=400682 RepID=A0A1X7TM83_AMPQE